MLPNTKDSETSMRTESKNVFDLFAGVDFEKGAKRWNWALTGHLYKPHKTCGKVFVVGCSNTTHHRDAKGKADLGVLGCNRLGCPTCYETSSGQRARVVVARFASKHFGTLEVEQVISEIIKNHRFDTKQAVKQNIIAYLEKSIGRQRLKVKHLVASPPQHPDAWLTHHDYTMNRKTAYRMLKNCGVQGGVLIPHPYRLKCADCGHHPIPDHRQECPSCHSDRFVWYFSPHFHIIGYGWVTNTTKNYRKTGWVIKNLGIRKSIYSTTQYLLSHAGCNKGTLTLNWFGCLSRQKLGKNPKIPKIQQHCAECGQIYKRLTWNKSQDRPPPKHTYQIDGHNSFQFSIGEYV